MKLSSFLSQLPPGGRSDFAKHIGVAPAYLYQMEKGIRPISPKRALSICEGSSWRVTPHELRPDIYPNPADGLPPERAAEMLAAASVDIKPFPKGIFTPFTGGGYIYSNQELARRERERRLAERRKAERREQERREDP